jgi:tetratricopeptide (TPR) repeat protein/tRNA A-37 threonylcarbamoyl transferase component Bud32
MSTTVEDLLGKTIILIAGGGDASRFVLPLLRDRLNEHGRRGTGVPLWLRRYCLATWQSPQSGLSFLASHLTFIRTYFDASFPVAVITGPNTNDAIVAHLGENNQFGLNNVTVIEQDSTSVFTPDGQLLFWENGEDLRAPNGTAGCIEALLESEWFRQRTQEGYEYVYIWYVNDLTAGHHIAKHLTYFAAGGSQWMWLSGPPGIELTERIVKTGNAKERMQLIHALEDSCGAYIFHHQLARELVKNADPHAVERKLPVVLQDGNFLRGYKRELFLCDSVWKLQEQSTTSTYSAIGRSAKAFQDPTLELPPTRAEQYFASLNKEKIKQALSSHQGIEIPHDLGIKKIGENLVEHWRIESVIHEGGMSTVYVCRDELDQERIAVKTYKENDRWRNPSVRAQFRKEGLAWITLEPHPHLIEALGIREIDGALHIFMEYAEGGNLLNRLEQLPMHAAIQIGIQVCDALQTIHDHGFLHKDVKPTNVLFDESGHAKLSDLGVAASFYGDDLREVAGTYFYMAPELFSGGNVANTSDIYSLGVMLYEMLTGVLPFLGIKSEIGHQHLSVPPVPLIDRISDLDTELNEIVMTCLAKEPQDRPQSATELRERLKSCYRRLTGQSYEPVVPPVDNAADTIRVGRKRVWAYQVLGRNKDAIDICEKLKQVFPENSVIAVDQAVLYYDTGRFTECTRMCLDLLLPSTTSEPEILGRADMLLEMCAIQLGKREEIVEAYTKWLNLAIMASTIGGDARKSLKLLELCILIDSNYYPAWIMKGQLLYELGDFREAMEALRTGLRTFWDWSQQSQYARALETLHKCELLVNPEIVQDVLQDVAATYLAISSGDPVAIEQATRRVLSRVPDSIWAMDRLGTALEQQERYDEAITCFKTVLEAALAHAHAHFTKGLAMLKSNKDLEATLTEFELSVAMNPNDYKALNMVGECYRLLGETSKAIEAFHKSLAINPQSIVALMAISTALVHSGQPDSAIYFANQAVQFYPSNPEAWEIRGDVLAAAGQPEQSLESWVKALLIGGITPRLFEKMRGALPENAMHKSTNQESNSGGSVVRETTDKPSDRHDFHLDPGLAGIYSNQGANYYALGKYEEALVEYTHALQLDPKLVQACTGRGNTYTALNRYEEALVDHNRAIQLDPKLALAHYNRGVTYAKMGRHKEALADYNHAIQLDPNLACAYSNRGTTYADLGKLEEGLADYNRALQLDPSDAKVYCDRGAAYEELGRHEEALADFRRAINIAPNLADAYLNRGNTYAALDRYDEALADHNRAIQLDPDRVLAYYNRGITYAKMGRHEEALADYTHAIQLDPNDTKIYYNRGVNYYELRRYQEALVDYNHALQLDPNDAKVYTRRGMTYAKLGKRKEALADYNRAIQLDPNDAKSYYDRGNTYFALGRYEEALADYTRAIQRDPNLVLAYTNRGNTYGVLGRRKDALADYTHALQLNLNLALAYLNIGVLYANANQLQQALPYFDKAAALGDPTGAQAAAQVRRKLGVCLT